MYVYIYIYIYTHRFAWARLLLVSANLGFLFQLLNFEDLCFTVEPKQHMKYKRACKLVISCIIFEFQR